MRTFVAFNTKNLFSVSKRGQAAVSASLPNQQCPPAPYGDGGAASSWRGGIAQLGERLLCKQEVIGSIPFASTRRLHSICIC